MDNLHISKFCLPFPNFIQIFKINFFFMLDFSLETSNILKKVNFTLL